MTAIVSHIVVLVGLILVSGSLVLAKFSVKWSRRPWLRERALRGDRGAVAALRLAVPGDRFAKAMDLGLAVISTSIGAYGGVFLAGSINTALALSIRLEKEARPLAMILAIGGVSIAMLVLGHWIPRGIAASRPEDVACSLGRLLLVYTAVLSPVVQVLTRGSNVLLRRLGAREFVRPPLTEEEIKDLMREGAQAGIIEEAKHGLFKRVLRFCDRRARALMTPRDQVVWVGLEDTAEEIRAKLVASPHSRIPVCDQSLDNLLGIVQVKDLLTKGTADQPFPFRGLLSLPAFVYEGTRGTQILDILRSSATHTAVVLDEYGSIVGLVTLDEILSAVLGELPEESEDEVPRSAPRPDGSWLLEGRFPVDEFRELFELDSLPSGDFHTLAGLIVTHLGHIPRVSESFDCLGLRFEIVEMDANRVDRVHVRPLRRPELHMPEARP